MNKINDTTLEEYMKYLNHDAVNKLDKKGIHDINHSYRVLFLSLVISEKLNINKEDRKLIALASLYHDVGRKNDDADVIHGILSWKKIKKQLEKILKEDELLIVKYIIENHCLPNEIAYKTVECYKTTHKNKLKRLLSIMKDADSLDIIRTGFFDKKYLRFSVSKHLIELTIFLNKLGDLIQKPIELRKILFQEKYIEKREANN